VLVLDAGALYAQADRAEPGHDDVVAILRAERGALVTTQVAAAEADYLILTRLGVDAELAFLRDLTEGTFLAVGLTDDDLRAAAAVAARYRDLHLGLADASLVVAAQRFRTRRIVTFDERAFRAVRPLQGGSFTVLPADA
jgi:predicted nucleic acid-binding protein